MIREWVLPEDWIKYRYGTPQMCTEFAIPHRRTNLINRGMVSFADLTIRMQPSICRRISKSKYEPHQITFTVKTTAFLLGGMTDTTVTTSRKHHGRRMRSSDLHTCIVLGTSSSTAIHIQARAHTYTYKPVLINVPKKLERARPKACSLDEISDDTTIQTEP
mmetsp:Transcript_3524/g.6269  ORF Transcript_3524/g.6269 Transcript_3524/m.6269 type:complete len:162 (-) Transcript_3524:354-839(-)